MDDAKMFFIINGTYKVQSLMFVDKKKKQAMYGDTNDPSSILNAESQS